MTWIEPVWRAGSIGAVQMKSERRNCTDQQKEAVWRSPC